MFRSVVGIVLVVLLATGMFVWQGVRAESLGSAPGTVDFASAQVVAHSAPLDSPSVGERPVFGEPSTLLLMGLALFGAARLARRA